MKGYVVFAVLFFVGVIAYIVVGLNQARMENEEAAEQQFQELTTQIQRSSAAAGSYSPQTVQMVIRNFASDTLQAFSSYSPNGETDYLYSKRQRYLAGAPEEARGSPRLQSNPVTEARLVRSISLPDGGSRLGEAVYVALTRSDLYRLLRHSLIGVVGFALLTTIITILSVVLVRNDRSAKEPAHAAPGAQSANSEAFRPEPVETPVTSGGSGTGTGAAAGSGGGADTPRSTEQQTESPAELGAAETRGAEFGYGPTSAHGSSPSRSPITFHDVDSKPQSAEPDTSATDSQPPAEQSQPPSEQRKAAKSSDGLFSKETGLSFEEHLLTRLALELERSAYNDQDLAVILVRFPELPRNDDSYARAAQALIRSFGFEDLSFEYGGDGFCVILPNTDLNRAIRAAEEFRGKVRKALPELPQPIFGVTARSGRLVEASRVLNEASTALARSSEEPGRIVGFRPDPQKYREYLADHDEE